MGCVIGKPAGEAANGEAGPSPDKAEEVKPQHDASDKDSKEESKEDVESARQKLEGNSRSVQAGFRHTSGLRVGVIESKRTSVTLLNDYIVLGGLGKGAYGSVKLCYSMQDDNLYALKVLQRAQLKRQMLGPRPSQSVPGALDQLRREVDVMRSMNHPNLIRIFEVIEADSKVIMVQEYAEAGPLQQPDQMMCESLAQYYFRQIVAGLAALHSNNVVHGDMKPDNVLLAGSGLVKIADFGQAQFFNEGADVFDKTLGTPAFMAPEVRSGDAYHGRPADMWALGVTLYCFLFADLPFKGGTLEELYHAIQTQEVTYPPEVPISDTLRSILDRLLSKDPAKRPTSFALMRHPWVAAVDEQPAATSDELSVELTRMDGAPSLEKWMNELSLEDRDAPLEVANEVAISVFGREILEGGQSITTQNIMDVILESNTDPVATPFRVSPTPGSAPQPQQQAQQGAAGPQAGTQQGKTFGRSGSIAVADAWMRQQQAAASMAALQAMQAGSTLLQSPRSPSPRSPSPQPQQLQFQSSGSLPTSLPTSKRGLQLPSTWAVQEQMTGLPPAPEPPLRMTGGEEVSAGPEELAAELDTLLGALSGEDFAGADLSTRVSMQLAGVAEEEGKEAHRADDPARPIIPLARQRHASLPAQNGSAFRRVNLQQASLPLPAATPFAASGNGRPPSGAHVRHWQSGSSAAPASSSNLSNNSCSLRPPMSPFESTPFGSLAHAASLPVLPSSTGVQHSPRDTLARVSGTPGTGTAAHMGPGARLQSTGEVWDAMRSKALMNNTPGVKFVQFAAGAEMDIPTQAAGAYCLLIESGIVDVRYVAVLDYNRQRSGARRGSFASKSNSDSEDEEEERRFERRDSVARGPEAQAVAPRRQRPDMAASPSLQDTVDRVLARAQRVLASANSNSEANMLCTQRGPNDFLGVSAILEPAQHRKLTERWRPYFQARTEVRGVALSRTAVELVLKHYPLAQVYLRLTLCKGRAEILQLESLENVATCLLPSKPSTPGAAGKASAGSSGPAERLDLFRAVSFARQLATQLADQVTNLDPIGEVAGAASHVADAAAQLPRLFLPDMSGTLSGAVTQSSGSFFFGGGSKVEGSSRSSGSFFRTGKRKSVDKQRASSDRK